MLGLLCAGLVLLGAACSYDEGYFNRKIKELDELAAKGSPEAREKIQSRKEALLEAFRKLPEGEGRKKQLDQLGRRARAAIGEAEQVLAADVQKKKTADKAKLKEYQKRFVGRWEGGGMKLRISPGGMVNYERRAGAGNRKINAFIAEFDWKQFKVGFMGINTTFRIDKPPYQEGGKWKMKIDGVELTRVGPGARFGTWVCPEVQGEACVGAATEFDAASLGKLHLLHITPKVPEKGQVFTVVWIVEDVGAAAAPGEIIAKTPMTYDGKDQARATHYTIHGHISLPRGWPPGSYRVEVREGEEKVVAMVKFTVVKKPAGEKPAGEKPER
jgi:hypothetical protein